AQPGKNVNLLQLGKGPFPVPFGQKADVVIKHFRPTTRPVAKTDPKNTDYIKLTTRRRYRKDFSVVWLEMWIDRKTSLPVKIVAEDRSENQTTVIFKDTETPKSFDKKTFTLPRPPAGWEYHPGLKPTGAKEPATQPGTKDSEDEQSLREASVQFLSSLWGKDVKTMPYGLKRLSIWRYLL
ncbi:MAG: hypothetical protein KAV00_14655, partial [Phycisphaerae bacterium]|nr:hypothetical protein [Phycisphaerae bacterium]